MIDLRWLEGALKWALRDFLREEARPANRNQIVLHGEEERNPEIFVGRDVLA